MSETTTPRRTSVVVLEELLAGKEVCASDFAKVHGCSDNNVAAILKRLGEAVTRRTVRSGKRFPRSYYRMADRAALQAKYDEIKHLRWNEGSTTSNKRRLDFGQLLNIWRIELPRGCTLPLS